MAVILYDLAGANDARFSPYCWRARMALAHKRLEVDARPVGFSEISTVAGGASKTVPVIVDGNQVVRDSWEIADYLERTYPSRPSLFGGESGQAICRFVQNWANAVVLPNVAPLVIRDIFDRVREEDRQYFRESREKRYGRHLEDVQANRSDRLEAFRALLVPLRLTLGAQPFLGGKSPNYADYIVFGTLQWPRVASPFRLLDHADPISDWMERCLDLHGGLGRRMPAAA